MAKRKTPPLDEGQTLEEWWEDDARRFNRACEKARQRGHVHESTSGPPPPLNEDGSLADEVEPE